MRQDFASVSAIQLGPILDRLQKCSLVTQHLQPQADIIYTTPLPSSDGFGKIFFDTSESEITDKKATFTKNRSLMM